jgi:integrase
LERLIQFSCPERENLDDMLARPIQRYIFVTPGGRRPHMFVGIFSRLMRDSGLRKDAPGRLNRSLYSLRHTYATQALARGVDIHTLARQMGTSVLMLEKHYSKLTPMLAADKLA